MRVIYLGSNKAKELPSVEAPMMQDHHDPLHFDMQKQVFIDHINGLTTFDVAEELAKEWREGFIYEFEADFLFKTIIAKP